MKVGEVYDVVDNGIWVYWGFFDQYSFLYCFYFFLRRGCLFLEENSTVALEILIFWGFLFWEFGRCSFFFGKNDG